MNEQVRLLVEEGWAERLGIDRAVLRAGGVHVIEADLGANDAMSFLFAETCIIAVRSELLRAARGVVGDLDAAFTADVLRRLVGPDVRVEGPSVHCYADGRFSRGRPDPSVLEVPGNDRALLAFLRANHADDLAESGFPSDPPAADPRTTGFWLLRDEGEVVAAGNLTEWRGVAADVGILTAPEARGQGFAGRLVSSMVAAALPIAGVVRYRCLASNVASLALARRIGFEPYGQNFRARRLALRTAPDTRVAVDR